MGIFRAVISEGIELVLGLRVMDSYFLGFIVTDRMLGFDWRLGVIRLIFEVILFLVLDSFVLYLVKVFSFMVFIVDSLVLMRSLLVIERWGWLVRFGW